MTQSVLAKEIGISLPQLVRYETKNVQPTAETLNKIANAFGVSIDFMVNGNLNEKAEGQINDARLLKQFMAVEKMSEEDKNIILQLIDAFITKKKIQKLAS